MVELKSVLAHISISLFVSTVVVICNNIFYNRKSQTPPPTKSNNSPRLFNQLN
jgi:hypothetical protein